MENVILVNNLEIWPHVGCQVGYPNVEILQTPHVTSSLFRCGKNYMVECCPFAKEKKLI